MLKLAPIWQSQENPGRTPSFSFKDLLIRRGYHLEIANAVWRTFQFYGSFGFLLVSCARLAILEHNPLLSLVAACWLYLKLVTYSCLSPILQVELASQCLKHVKLQHDLFDQDYLTRIVPTRAGWWFGTFFIFPYIDNQHPNWRHHIFQRVSNHQPERICAFLSCWKQSSSLQRSPASEETFLKLCENREDCGHVNYSLNITVQFNWRKL